VSDEDDNNSGQMAGVFMHCLLNLQQMVIIIILFKISLISVCVLLFSGRIVIFIQFLFSSVLTGLVLFCFLSHFFLLCRFYQVFKFSF